MHPPTLEAVELQNGPRRSGSRDDLRVLQDGPRRPVVREGPLDGLQDEGGLLVNWSEIDDR